MGMRATVIQYPINVRTPQKKGRTKLEQEKIWNGFKMYQHNWFFGCSKNHYLLEHSKPRTVSPFPNNDLEYIFAQSKNCVP